MRPVLLLAAVPLALAHTSVAWATTPARLWMERAEAVIEVAKPGPPDAARTYAYVATAYRDALLATGDSAQAGDAAHVILRALHPKQAVLIDNNPPTQLPAGAETATSARRVVSRLLHRMSVDGRAGDNPDAAMRTAPTGPAYWVRTHGKGPANPTAGSWRRWAVGARPFLVPRPPAFGSARHRSQLSAVRRAVVRRDARWVRVINFWGGVPGTHTPAGIWQDRLAVETQETLGTNDRAYAITQAALAQGVADAFMECWKVKFRYWTARPNMVDSSIPLAMDNPPFPSYVSGHSTVSAAAAEVLSAMVPSLRRTWWTDAAAARDSRLYAGIHFLVDNAVGFALGRRVGARVVARMHLRSQE